MDRRRARSSASVISTAPSKPTELHGFTPAEDLALTLNGSSIHYTLYYSFHSRPYLVSGRPVLPSISSTPSQPQDHGPTIVTAPKTYGVSYQTKDIIANAG